ncbi:MAG: NAD(+) kinase [Gammaproteobacteria bacterium]|nr:NAD(+) kinase [Gammaproteobacteria bacterium]
MSLAFQHIGLIAKKSDPEVAAVLNTLHQYFEQNGITVFIEKETAELVDINAQIIECYEFSDKCDLAVVIGGDGTLLAAARALGDTNTPLLGVHMGRLGFLADVTPEAMIEQLDEILAGHYLAEQRTLLKSSVVRDGKPILEIHALNDIVVHKWASSRMVELEMFIDNVFVSTERSDGLIVSTPTGSTAYALSGGGPIVHPSLNAVVLVPICPHTLSHRPIVISGDSTIELVITDSNVDSTKLSCDGQSAIEIVNGDKIIIEKSDQRTHLIHPKAHNHFNTLRTKLGWGTTPDRAPTQRIMTQ